VAISQIFVGSEFRVIWRVKFTSGTIKVSLSNSHVKSIGFPRAKSGGLAWFGFGLVTNSLLGGLRGSVPVMMLLLGFVPGIAVKES